MAEVLSELVAKIVADASGLKQGLQEADKSVKDWAERNKGQLKAVGGVLTGFGAGIVASFGMAAKAAADEQQNVSRLAMTLKNVGVEYDTVKESLEGVISATQKKTGIADDQQRDVLNRLLLVTNDYNKALQLLPTTLDLAAAGQMDATTAATYLGRAYEELENGAESVSVRFGQASLQFKSMADIQKRVAGAAEATVNPFNVLKASLSDVTEKIGSVILPIINKFVGVVATIADKIQSWVDTHPELAKQLMIVIGVVGLFAAVLGPILLMLPALTTAFSLLLGPVGLVIAGVMLLTTVGILLWQNWDKITEFFKQAWQNIKIFFLTGISKILDGLAKFIGWIPGIGQKIEQLRDKVQGMLNAEKVKKDAGEITSAIQEVFSKQAEAIQAAFDKQKQAAQSAYDAAVKAINKEYGIGEAAKEVSRTKIELARETTARLKEQYEQEIDKAKTRYDSEIEYVQELRDAKLEALNIETDATVKALQDQIDAIDRQTAAEDLALQRQEEAKKLAALSGKEREEFSAEIARRELLRSRSAEKDALRDRIAEAREQANKRKDQIQSETDAALKSLKTRYEAEVENFKNLALAADSNLEKELARIEQDRIAKIDAETAKLNAEIARLDKAEQEEVKFYADQLTRANQQVKDINVAYDSLKKRYDIDIVTHETTGDTGRGVSIGPFTGTDEEWERRRIQGFAHGGIVPGPVGMPQLAMVHGGEAVIPETLWGDLQAAGQQMMTVILEIDGRKIATAIMPYAVGEIRTRTGLK